MRATGWATVALSLGLVVGSVALAAPPHYDPDHDSRAAGPNGAQPSATASVSALPSSDVAPPVSSARGAWDPDLSAPALPENASPKPALAEWANAPEAVEARITQPDCKVRRIREWYRVECGGNVMERITGSAKDIEIDCQRPYSPEFCQTAYVIFPARRGDVRGFELFERAGWGLRAEALVSEQYLPGDKLPLITVYGIRWGF